MPQEFLCDLDVDLHLTKHGAEAVPERVPPDPLPHTHLRKNRADVPLENHVRLERLIAVLLDGGKEIVGVSSIN
jgi:hypothetical protein